MLLTGRNGSGKSHLLRAIHSGDIEDPTLRVRTQFIPANWYVDDGEGSHEMERITSAAMRRSHNLREWVRQAPELDSSRLSEAIGDQNPDVAALLRRFGDKALEMDEHEVLASDLQVGSFDLLSRSLERSFATYGAALRTNAVRTAASAVDGSDSTNMPLDDERFLATYGRAPWTAINEALDASELGVRVSPPNLLERAITQLEFETPGGKRLRISDLSSGERMVVCLVAQMILFADGVRRESSTAPAVFLLDEVDASLDPTATRALIATLRNLCTSDAVYVMLATHSPISVGLARPGEVFDISRDENGHRLESVQRSDAITSLTQAVPEIRINSSNILAVLTESHIDAERYNRIYGHFRRFRKGEPPRNLVFLPAAGDHDGNRSSVISAVDKLRGLDNRSIAGIVDWDQDDAELPPGTVVLGRHTRYTLESVICDPLLVVALCVLSHWNQINAESVFGIESSDGQFALLSTEQRQQASRALYASISQERWGSEESQFEYGIGSTDLLRGPSCLAEAAPFAAGKPWMKALADFFYGQGINRYRDNPDQIADQVIDEVLARFPELWPVELERALLQLEGLDLAGPS
ncbi:MAG: ATP-binding protein [Actinomycetota bacterium]